MEILEFLGGQKFFMILGLFVAVMVLYTKLKNRRHIKSSTKKRKKRLVIFALPSNFLLKQVMPYMVMMENVVMFTDIVIVFR